jgi:hypothetical protein
MQPTILKKSNKARNVKALRRTRELLTPEKNWMKGDFIQTEDGYQTEVKALEQLAQGKSCKFCLAGAFRVACYEDDRYLTAPDGFNTERDSFLSTLMNACIVKVGGQSRSAISFNDCFDTTHEQVLKALDCAIEEEAARPEPKKVTRTIEVELLVSDAAEEEQALNSIIATVNNFATYNESIIGATRSGAKN